MKVFTDITGIREFTSSLRQQGQTIGFVPTMGFLHEGHMTLMRFAQTKVDCVVASIFVNPTQFGPTEDFEAYPRDLEGDLAKAAAAGCAAVFVPPVDIMYDASSATHISVTGLTDHLCGASRPGHFDGVCTVVLKLFNIVQCQVAVFGQKDYQQLAVIRRMVSDLNVDVDIQSHPIVREHDGLAMSSRNAYLNPAQRQQALCLKRGLTNAAAAWHHGERDMIRLRDAIVGEIATVSDALIDYVQLSDAHTLEPIVGTCIDDVVCAVAVHIGSTRLIDNCVLSVRNSDS